MNMSIRQVLVHLDATAASAARLQAARAVAQSQGASLTALYAAAPSFVELPYGADLAGSAAATLAELDDERRAQARKTFDGIMATPGCIGEWGETSEVPLLGAFAEQALYADLLVLGQRDRGDPAGRALPPDFTEAVIAASGKPALVLPYTGWSHAIGETVVVAWKPTREATRAVCSAMPMLQRARRVHVVSWSEPDEPAVTGARLDLDGYLRLHGVEPTWHRYGKEVDAIGELLLSSAFDLDADLLVMGCYGHSRAREWVLGGVSRTVLGAMTLPVWMVH
jgi:nucleotide-binding universal stress UspA family protein